MTEETHMLPSEAARELEVSARTIDRYGDAGLLTVTMTPYGRLFDRAQVKALAEKRRQREGALAAA